jgi:hypothetical protein
MSTSTQWFVAVFKCDVKKVKKTILEFYSFVDELEGVQSLHFSIRDRIEDDVVFSFRILVEPKSRDVVKTKLIYKLGTLLTPDEFAINPSIENNLAQYVAWSPKKRISDFGESKFSQFIDTLKDLSSITIRLIEQDYFDSSERIELAHVVSWMLGCTEYGLLSKSGMEVGYYDRIEDKYHPYLQQSFHEPTK